MALLRNGANRYQFRMKQENELKSLLTDQEFEASDNRELLLAQAKACANGYALATEGIAVVSDFQNKECHIYPGRFGQTIMNLPEYMVDRNSAFEDIVFCHVKEDELIERHVLELRFFNFIKERSIKEKTNFSASCILNFYRAGDNEKVKILHTTRYFSVIKSCQYRSRSRNCIKNEPYLMCMPDSKIG